MIFSPYPRLSPFVPPCLPLSPIVSHGMFGCWAEMMLLCLPFSPCLPLSPMVCLDAGLRLGLFLFPFAALCLPLCLWTLGCDGVALSPMACLDAGLTCFCFVCLCPPCLPSVSLLSPVFSPLFPSVSFCLPSCLSSCWSLCSQCLPLSPVLSPFLLSFCFTSCLFFCWSLCPPCLPSLSLLVGHCVRLVSLSLPFSPCLFRFSWVTVSALPPFVSLLVYLLVGHCVRLASLLSPFVSLLVGQKIAFPH